MTTKSIFGGKREKLFFIATEEYVNFRYSKTDYSREWEEEYKYEILDGLNKELSVEDISADTVLDITRKLKEKNPQTGSFVHWSNLDDCSSFVESRPETVSNLLINLFSNRDSISDSITDFREKGKDFDQDISLGTPLFGYIMAAFDNNNYTIYKDGPFRDFSEWFDIDIPSEVGKKYERFLELCKKIRDHFREEDVLEEEPSLLDAQDFIFSISGYPSLRFKIALRYLAQFSGELAHYEESPSDFLASIQEMDKSYLKKQLENLNNPEKIRLIRYQIISEILNNTGDMKIENMNEIMENVAHDYDTDILHSWDYFKILFGIYFDRYKEVVNSLLYDIHKIVRKSFSEETFAKEKSNVVHDFSWNRNYGTPQSFVVFYPPFKDSYQESVHLFLEVNNGSVGFGLNYGNEVKGDHGKDAKEVSNPEEIFLDDVVNKFQEVLPTYREENRRYWKISPGKGAKEWDNFKQGSYIAINWNELGYPKRDIRQQITEDDLDFEAKYVEKQFDYFENQMSIGDIVVAYGNTTILGIGKIEGEYFKEENANQFQHRRKVKWLTTSEIPVKEIGEIFYERMSASQTIISINKPEFIEKVHELLDIHPPIPPPGPEAFTIPTVSFRQNLEITDLYFPKEESARLKSQISAALRNGKHIILIGPPGTGKSKLAREVCESFVSEDYKMVTATSDWSTFDTVGGYHPTEEGSLNFQPGIFLESFKEADTNKPRNRWLILDEINRADIDKAFGSLFSALTGDEITLSFKAKNGKSVLVRPPRDGEETVAPTDHEYIIPSDWRLIATMNTYDKTSLYEMSYAFMRRFAFISVPAPERASIGVEIGNYLDRWGIDERKFAPAVAKLWKEINRVRKIGPATVKDIYETLLRTTADEHDTDLDYSSALIMHVLPQFEGLLEEDIVGFVKCLERVSEEIDEFDSTDMAEIKKFATEYFQINRKKLETSSDRE